MKIEQLAWLGQHQDALTALIGAAGERRGWWQVGGAWLRRFARWDPLDSPYCTLLFESQGDRQYFCVVETYAQPSAPRSEHEEVLAHAPLGWIVLTRFPHDPGLPTLPDVLKDATQAKVVRYRPRMRCTLQLGGGELFAKVFPDHDGAAIHEAGLLLWSAAAQGELGFHVAQPQCWEAAKLCLWQGRAPGEPASPQLRGAQGPALAQRQR
jgi:hypothetical protein